MWRAKSEAYASGTMGGTVHLDTHTLTHTHAYTRQLLLGMNSVTMGSEATVPHQVVLPRLMYKEWNMKQADRHAAAALTTTMGRPSAWWQYINITRTTAWLPELEVSFEAL